MSQPPMGDSGQLPDRAVVFGLTSVSKFSNDRPRRHILNEVSISIRKADRVCLVGPNGSGKSTLIKVLIGAAKPDFGAVTLPRNGLSYVPQDYRNALFPWLSLEVNLNLCRPGGSELPDLHRAFMELSERFKLNLDLRKHPYELSGGEQQLFVLMRAICACCDVLVCDETLSAVDFGRKQLVLRYLLNAIPERSLTVVWATHDFEEAVMLSDRIVVLDPSTGKLKESLRVKLPWPRRIEARYGSEFKTIVDTVTEAVL